MVVTQDDSHWLY